MREPRRGSIPGLTSDDEAGIAGRALGGHIWDSMEQMIGGPGSFRASVVTDAWSDTHKAWQGQDVRADADDDDYPVFHHKVGEFTAKYPIGGPYVTMHRGGQAVEALHMQEEDRHPEGVKRRAEDWHREDSQYY